MIYEINIEGETVSMRALTLKSPTLLLVLVLLLSACSKGNDSQNSASAVKKGGEITFGAASPVAYDYLDPHVIGSTSNFRVMRSIFDSLVVELDDHSIKPWLAESWTVSDDQKTYTFKLRKDIKFHDGTPFNAAAVKFNFDRIKDPKTKSFSAINLIGPYVSSDVVDEFTVKIILSEPFVPFLANISRPQVGILSPAAAEKFGDKLFQNPVGTGPFKLAKYVANVQVDLEKNPDYNWAPTGSKHNGPAYVDKITYKIVPEEATRLASLQSQQVLAIDTVPPQNVATIKTDKNLSYTQLDVQGVPYQWWFNAEKAPWTDVKLRQAFISGLDIDSIVNSLYFGVQKRAWGVLSPTTFAQDKSLDNAWKPDVDKANKQLDELGWVKGADGIRVKDGQRLVLKNIEPTGNSLKKQDIATIIQEQAKKLGVEVATKVLNSGEYSEAVSKGNFDTKGESMTGGDPDTLRTVFFTGVTSNFARLKDSQLDGWLLDANKEPDSKKREEIYKKIQQYVVKEKAYSLPIFIPTYSIANTKKLVDFRLDGAGLPWFYDAWIDQ